MKHRHIAQSVMALVRWTVLLMALPAFAAEAPRATHRLTVHGTIEIAADGSVRSHQLEADTPAFAKEPLDREIRNWRFEPVVVDGNGVNLKTGLQLTLALEPVDTERYQLRLSRALFGDALVVLAQSRPEYPAEAAGSGLAARVVLILKTDAKGKVKDAHVYQVSLGAKTHTEGIAEQWRAIFAKASLYAARRWKIGYADPSRTGSLETLVMAPLQFLISGTDEKTQGFVPGPVHLSPWSSEYADPWQEGSDRNSGMFAVDPRVKLRGDVAGKLL